jgi:phage terminase large subunit-like protein
MVTELLPEELALREIDKILATRKLDLYTPYPKQAEFHRLGGEADVRERLLMAANQSGKTVSASAETAMHLTGKYPEWWDGVRYDRPVTWMAASETGKLTRDGVQVHLCGWPKHPRGTGMVPGVDLLETPAASGIADFYDYLRVQHHNAQGEPDGVSLCYLRSYDQGRERVQAMTLDGVWLDEEPEMDFYMECLTRTNVVLGPVYLTFTPLKGMSDVVRRFLIEKAPGTAVVSMTIEDALHYSPEQRRKIIASYPAHERDARAMGIPVLGSGRIFPVEESRIKQPARQIPSWMKRIVGVDFGYDHPTAAVWVAYDPDTDVAYVYDAYRVREASPALHSVAIKSRGAWIPVAWPHDGYQHDKGGSCEALAEQYRKLGLNMHLRHATHPPAPDEKEGEGGFGREAGLMMMLDRMQTERLKVADHLNDWWEEFRLYHRKDGKVVEVGDDLMSATRIALMMLRHAQPMPVSPQATFWNTVKAPQPSGTMGAFGV